MNNPPEIYKALLEKHLFWPEILDEYERYFMVEELDEKQFLKTFFKQELKDKVSEALKTGEITMITVQCSSRPYCSAGNMYYFFVEKENLILIDADKGTWRGI